MRQEAEEWERTGWGENMRLNGWHRIRVKRLRPLDVVVGEVEAEVDETLERLPRRPRCG